MIRHDMTWNYMEHSGMVSAELEVGMPLTSQDSNLKQNEAAMRAILVKVWQSWLHPNCCISCALLSRPKQNTDEWAGAFW